MKRSWRNRMGANGIHGVGLTSGIYWQLKNSRLWDLFKNYKILKFATFKTFQQNVENVHNISPNVHITFLLGKIGLWCFPSSVIGAKFGLTTILLYSQKQCEPGLRDCVSRESRFKIFSRFILNCNWIIMYFICGDIWLATEVVNEMATAFLTIHFDHNY